MQVSVSNKSFIGEQLGLTGCEISFGQLEAGQAVPFLHTHKQNEEVYIITKGDGTFSVDGEDFEVSTGHVVRVATAGKRGIKAGESGIEYICIQAKEGSLTQKTADDGIIF